MGEAADYQQGRQLIRPHDLGTAVKDLTGRIQVLPARGLGGIGPR